MSLAKFLSILIRKFPPFFAWFVPQNFPQHQTSTACFGTCGGSRVTLVLPRSPVRFPASTPKPRAEGRASASGALPRADRSGAKTKSFCPCQKSQVSLVRYLTFFVSGHKGSATRCGCALRSACRGASACRWRSAANRPRRQARQVFLPLPQNRRKLWVSAGFLFACVAWEWGSFWFGHWVFSSGLTRSQPFPSPPAPKTHPTSAVFA